MNVAGKNLKTICSNLNIEIIDDLFHFHNKGNLALDRKFYHRVVPHTLTLDQFKSLERSDYEIVPFHDGDIPCDTDQMTHYQRSSSASKFSNELIPFEKIKSLLANAFAKRNNGNRPYPSGGALYPVEVICILFSEKISQGPESGFYHFRPSEHILQPIIQMESEEIRRIIFGMELKDVNSPNFAIIYMGVVGKMLVKYRYRGYRYALMETGAMFHQADFIAQSLGIVNKLYSGFNDHEIVKMIGLDRMSFIPFVIQSFGVSL